MLILKELKRIEKRLAEAKEREDKPMINLWTRAKKKLEREIFGEKKE